MSDELTRSEPRKEEPQSPNVTGHPKEEIRATNPCLPASAPEIDFSPAINRQENRSKKFEKFKSEFKFWVEMAGILVGVGVAYLIYLQYGEMVKATKVTENQLREMKDARILDERAWVAPFKMAIEHSASDTNWIYINLMFKNTGKTPALNVSESHKTCWLFEVPTNNPPIPTNSMMLAPDGASFLRVGPIYHAVIDDAVDNPWCVYGKIKYDDIFGIHHWTEFCWSVERRDYFRPAPVHNSCDDATRQK